VFLPFGLKIITGFEDNFWIALAIVVAFIVSSAGDRLRCVASYAGCSERDRMRATGANIQTSGMKSKS
jgi:hypothetical protein